jgi:hypothetical protein
VTTGPQTLTITAEPRQGERKALPGDQRM